MLSEETGIAQVFLINDLEAKHIDCRFEKEDMIAVYAGNAAAKGNAAIIAPGTGLEKRFVLGRSALRPFATEGGHTDFAPRNDFDWELLQEYLHHKFGHVGPGKGSCGPGVCNIYNFLRKYKTLGGTRLAERGIMETQDPGATIVSLRRRAALSVWKRCRFLHVTLP